MKKSSSTIMLSPEQWEYMTLTLCLSRGPGRARSPGSLEAPPPERAEGWPTADANNDRELPRLRLEDFLGREDAPEPLVTDYERRPEACRPSSPLPGSSADEFP